MEQTHILNGCPTRTSVQEARTIMNLDRDSDTNATFLMPIRDPVDRIVSDLNEGIRRRGAKYDLEEKAKEVARGNIHRRDRAVWFQGTALQNLLSVVTDPRRVLIVPLESMSWDMQGVIDDIMDHIGAERWKVNETSDGHMNAGRGKEQAGYVGITNATRDLLRVVFRDDVLLLESLVGRQFAWSSWARDGETKEEDRGGYWRTATPHPRMDVPRADRTSHHRKMRKTGSVTTVKIKTRRRS